MTTLLQASDGIALNKAIVGLAQNEEYVDLATALPGVEAEPYFIEELKKCIGTENMQYARLTGSEMLVEKIEKTFKTQFATQFDGYKNVMVGSGSRNCIQNCILGFCDKEDEIVVFEPFSEALKEQVSMTGATIVPVPFLKPSFTKVIEGQKIVPSKWEIDYDSLKKAISSKTKLVMLSTVHQPTGKVFTKEEFEKIKELTDSFPRLRVVQDCSDFMNTGGKEQALFANLPGAFEKTLSVFSAGKILNASGIKVGWVIGSEDNLRPVCAFHQVNTFCLWEPLQNAVAKSLLVAEEKGLLVSGKADLRVEENKELAAKYLTEIKAEFYFPEGGNYLLVKTDVSATEFAERAVQKKVLVFPCTFNFSSEKEHFVRISLHKTKEALIKGLENLK